MTTSHAPRRLLVTAVALAVPLLTALPATAARAYVQIVQVSRVVAKGDLATLRATVKPSRAKCDLVIYLRSGRSYASGLGPKRAVNGHVEWTWTVSEHTTGGTWPIYVECGSTGIAKTWFKVF